MLIKSFCVVYSEADDMSWRRKYLRVKSNDTLQVGDYIKYRCEIGNLGYITTFITGIVMEDENVLKLDDHVHTYQLVGKTLSADVNQTAASLQHVPVEKLESSAPNIVIRPILCALGATKHKNRKKDRKNRINYQ